MNSQKKFQLLNFDSFCIFFPTSKRKCLTLEYHTRVANPTCKFFTKYTLINKILDTTIFIIPNVLNIVQSNNISICIYYSLVKGIQIIGYLTLNVFILEFYKFSYHKIRNDRAMILHKKQIKYKHRCTKRCRYLEIDSLS